MFFSPLPSYTCRSHTIFTSIHLFRAYACTQESHIYVLFIRIIERKASNIRDNMHGHFKDMSRMQVCK